jgi:hypothetical protein
MLILGLGIIAYVTLQSGGGKVMEQTETIKILDQPNGPKEKARRYNTSNEESVESLLRSMAEQFSEEGKAGSSPKRRKETNTKKAPIKKLSSDEKKYYEGVRKKASFRDQIETAKDWYSILSTSQKTYSKVKEIFGEAARQPEEKVDPNNLNQQLKTAGSSADFYQKLSETFQIKAEDIEAFGRTGQRALSDWAEFVESESKK